MVSSKSCISTAAQDSCVYGRLEERRNTTNARGRRIDIVRVLPLRAVLTWCLIGFSLLLLILL